MRLVEVADTSAAVAATSGRLAKVELLADLLRRADVRDVAIVTSYLTGAFRQRRTGLGYAVLRDMPPAAASPSLVVVEVDATLQEISDLSGKGSATARREKFRHLLERATDSEQRLLAGLVAGELRQGALDGVLTDAVAVAAHVPGPQIRRAVTVAGALPAVAEAVLSKGADGLTKFQLQVGSPVKPMLASPGTSLAEAVEQCAGDDGAAVERKFDGVRVHAHKNGDTVWVFTRTLDDITARVREIVLAVQAMPAETVVLDGEAIALRPDGRPRPFQETSARVMSAANPDTPLSVFWFDCLFLEGDDLIGKPTSQRWARLGSIVPADQLVPRLITSDVQAAAEFFEQSVKAGHEGVIVKDLAADYQAGRRGASWLKVKPRHTLDLVVLAAEWGHGRRTGKLSNLHLGARDPDGTFGPPGGFVMLGKTFKGLTDVMLNAQTARFLAIAEGPTDDWVVHVKPEVVVEIAFDGVQTSPRYPAGVALRFARVLRYRDDKRSHDADTIDAVLALR